MEAFSMTFFTLVKMVHLIGLIMGLGGAIVADLMMLRDGVFRPVRTQTVEAARSLSMVVAGGLALLWASGVALVLMNVWADPQALMNEKMWAKVIIVVVLTINGLLVHTLVFPHLAQRVGKRLFDQSDPLLVSKVTLVAAVSNISWVLPFVLGTATEFNFTVSVASVLLVYAGLVLAAWGVFTGLALLMADQTQGAVEHPDPAHAGESWRIRRFRYEVQNGLQSGAS
jgi:hypothetical protein